MAGERTGAHLKLWNGRDAVLPRPRNLEGDWGSSPSLRLIGDLELGAGGGVGGRTGTAAAEWSSLSTLGIYEGLGLGVQWKWLGVYVRGRLDAAGGDRLPTTLWPTLMLGLEARPIRWLSFGVGGGYAGYWNKNDRLMSFWFYQAQLALIFDVLSAS